MTFLEYVGTIGSLCLAVCGLPQLVKTLRTKEAESMSASFLYLWWGGEVCSLVYIIGIGNTILAFNYSANVIIVSVVLYYKLKGNGTKS